MKQVLKKVIHSGFTLIELVITIIVIGILSAALVATYSDVSAGAKDAATKASLSSLQSQIAIYLGKNNELPSMDQLIAQMPGLAYGAANTNQFQVTVNGQAVIIYAYQDGQCTNPTFQHTSFAKVACVNLTYTGP